MVEQAKLYLIDATAFCYRAFYALPGLFTSWGQPTNAIYGFVAMLKKLIQENKAEYLGVCFDVSRDTFRSQKFALYKAQRPPMPEDLSSQIPFIKKIICAFGITLLEKEGFEADDLIATLARKAAKEGIYTVIVSSDKDMLQLVNDYIKVYSPYKDSGILYDENKVKERFGVEPRLIPDVIALMGDSTDNIPGLPGVGEKTAVALIKRYGSVEGLLSASDEMGEDRLFQIIREHKEMIRLNRELATLDKDTDLKFDIREFKISQPDYRQLYSIFMHLQLKKFLQELPMQPDSLDVEPVAVPFLQDWEIEKFLPGKDSLYIFGQPGKEFFISNGMDIARIHNIGANLKKILLDHQIKKIGHDLKGLRIGLSRMGLGLEGLYFDTMIAAYLINPVKHSYQIRDLAWEYLSEIVDVKIMSGLKAMQFILRLFPLLKEKLEEKGLWSLFTSVEMPLVEVLADMECEGIKLDSALLKKLSREIDSRLSQLCQEVFALSGVQFNINSTKQLRQILFERLNLPVVKKTKTGPSTDEEVLRALSAEHKIAKVLLEYRQLTKLKNTYIDTLPDMVDKNTGRIHASFNQTGTETGRLSSSNPNLQNLPIKTDIGKLIRQAIISYEKNDYILSCDYSQIELRVLAHLSKDEELIRAFKQDKDIHKVTASLIYGLNEDEITDSMRETAKRVNFGIIYGLTAFGLARDLGIAQEEAQHFIEMFFSRYPKVELFIQEKISQAENDGFVTTLLGRWRPLPEIKNKNLSLRQFAQRQAVNTPIQGSASDIIKLAMVKIFRQIREKKFSSRLILQVHDELVFNLVEKEKDEFIPMVQEKMEKALELEVPLKVVIKRGKNWLNMEEV